MCYEEGVKMDSRFRGNDSLEEGVKWLKTQETEPKTAIPGARFAESEARRAKARRSYVCFCAPSDDRCPPYRRTMASLAEALVGVDLREFLS